jgi:electron transport complex protein RnfC
MFKIKRFVGGVHPDDLKRYTEHKAIEYAPLPDKVIIPMRQHIGAPCTPTVKKGDHVKKGQIIAKSDAFVSGNIHASISGIIVDFGEYPHPVFGRCPSLVVENDWLDEWVEGIPFSRDWTNLEAKELLDIIRDAGIVGMGGATFPTHVKLSPPEDKKIDTFILNAAECEPYLTADHRMMLEHMECIVTGVKIVMKVLNVENAYIGIEDNKPDAIESMKIAFRDTKVKVVSVPTKYPQGAEKVLIKRLLGREVPSGQLPMDVGVVVNNVGTIVAISNAVIKGIPLIERVVTVSGRSVKEPKNLMLRMGSTFEFAINCCGGLVKPPEKIIMGGPMMGIAQSSMDVPIVKGVSGILCLSKQDVHSGNESTCIHCTRCVQGCPMGLNPSMLSKLGEHNFYQEAKVEYNLFDCVECGSCVFICPAHRNIVQYIRYMKTMNAQEANKNMGVAK